MTENTANNKLILLTNDDGVHSPGLYAAADALSSLGHVVVVAPREQWTGAGRSLPLSTGGIIETHVKSINNNEWELYGVDGAPAQAVQHALLEILPRRPDLVVAGINYGENVGSGVTVSGTVGAALEAAAFGIPALAASLETPKDDHLSLSTAIDFAVAGYFTRMFAQLLLNMPPTADVDVLKLDVPAGATVDTPWQVTHQSRQRYYEPVKPIRDAFSIAAKVGYNREAVADLEPDSDVAAVLFHKVVSVTPLSLDLTSRINLKQWEGELKKSVGQ
jgi:5'-nucleotidase